MATNEDLRSLQPGDTVEEYGQSEIAVNVVEEVVRTVEHNENVFVSARVYQQGAEGNTKVKVYMSDGMVNLGTTQTHKDGQRIAGCIIHTSEEGETNGKGSTTKSNEESNNESDCQQE